MARIVDALKEIFAQWMPDGKITGAALGSAVAAIVLIFWQPPWETWQFVAVVFAAGIVTGYFMPREMPWNRGTD